jgi:hypothetical protein
MSQAPAPVRAPMGSFVRRDVKPARCRRFGLAMTGQQGTVGVPRLLPVTQDEDEDDTGGEDVDSGISPLVVSCSCSSCRRDGQHVAVTGSVVLMVSFAERGSTMTGDDDSLNSGLPPDGSSLGEVMIS